jgi:hypothetical protein
LQDEWLKALFLPIRTYNALSEGLPKMTERQAEYNETFLIQTIVEPLAGHHIPSYDAAFRFLMPATFGGHRRKIAKLF